MLAGDRKTKIVVIVIISVVIISGATVYVAVASNLSDPSVSKTRTAVPPSLTLLAGAAGWAAHGGRSALFIDWEDNYLAHGNTDGINWGPWPTEALMKNWTNSVAYALKVAGLDVHFAGDIPSNLTGYNLLVIAAYWSVDPSKLAEVRDFISSGGGVILLSGVPEFFRCYCKDWWTYRCPTDNASLDMSTILGCGCYVNAGGYANLTVDNPFGTSLRAGDTLIQGVGYSNAAEYVQNTGSNVIATWEGGLAFAYTYQYCQGRVYYQASFVCLNTPAKA
jgi:hypothetical protein